MRNIGIAAGAWQSRRVESFNQIAKLTERQKEILRLLFNGHDAKSAALELGISVHTVNEHLGEARRALGVSSSRAAARLFAQSEGHTPRNQGPDDLGVAAATDPEPQLQPAGARKRFVLIGGSIMVLVSVAVLGFIMGSAGNAPDGPSAAPRVVATVPADGSTIAAGPFDLTVRFDRPMRKGGYSFVQVSRETFPDCAPNARISADGMSYTMRCEAVAGRAYEVWFNRPPYMNFKSLDGVSAQPHRIRFNAKAG